MLGWHDREVVFWKPLELSSTMEDGQLRMRCLGSAHFPRIRPPLAHLRLRRQARRSNAHHGPSILNSASLVAFATVRAPRILQSTGEELLEAGVTALC